jgi:hypothetical protein
MNHSPLTGKNKPIYMLLIVFTLIATLGGFLTLLPWPWASYPNVMGYHSLCTFAPAATFFCWWLAGLSCTIRATFIRETGGSVQEKMIKHLYALLPLLVLLVLAIGASIWFTSIKGIYSDASTGASLITP